MGIVPPCCFATLPPDGTSASDHPPPAIIQTEHLQLILLANDDDSYLFLIEAQVPLIPTSVNSKSGCFPRDMFKLTVAVSIE